jgi:Asp-tRNA(Asn)/Glu-tRNA(Gln) amidotransferase A subunit family amidase
LRELEACGVVSAHKVRFDPTVIPLPSTTSLDGSSHSLQMRSSVPGRVFYSSADYVAAYKARIVTPTVVAQRILDTYFVDDKNLCFIWSTSREQLLSAANKSTTRYAAGHPLPLDGVPLVVKDELDIMGTPKTLGLSSEEAIRRGIGIVGEDETSWCVQKLLDAGMLFIGKTNMHECGLDTTNNNPNYGTPPNPYNKHFYPGGSSGGSGACLGNGLVPIAVGADGGGSIRIPASYCGVYGLKPSHGRISVAPMLGICPSVGVVGPMAATMDDLDIAYRLMATPDTSGLAGASAHFPPPGTVPYTNSKTLGIYGPWFQDCDTEVFNHTRAAIERFRDVLGYNIVDITLPYLPESQKAHAMTIITEICCGVLKDDTHGLTPAGKLTVAIGSRTSAREFQIAQRFRSMMMSHLSYLFQKHSGMIIVTPTIPHAGVAIPSTGNVAQKNSTGHTDTNTSLRTMQFVYVANWTGCPAITMPCGYDAASNIPIGLMGMAEWGAEDLLIAWGKEWEREWEGGGSGKESGRKKGESWVDLLNRDAVSIG